MARASPRPPARPDNILRGELELTCMRNLLSSTEERVYFKDMLSRFLLVSAGWVAAYTPGRSAAELVGKTDFEVFSYEHASTAFEDEQRIIRTGEPIVGKVERETYEGRADAWVSTTKMPLRDASGRIIGTFGISRDVTAQIKAESTLARQARLLRTQNEDLRELDRLKDEVMGLVSHELRAPLTSIIGHTEMLKDEGGAGPDAGAFVTVIERDAKRLLRLAGDLLYLSGIETGKMAMELCATDLAGLAASVVSEMTPEAERKRVELALHTAPLPLFSADPERISQLLGNLLSNAVKFTPPGGRVEVRLGAEQDMVVLTVADTGIGIPATDQKRVFERFFRTAAAIQEAIPGTGLGLAIVKAIVAAHNGAVSVDSREGEGSTFTVRLPSASPPATLAGGGRAPRPRARPASQRPERPGG